MPSKIVESKTEAFIVLVFAALLLVPDRINPPLLYLFFAVLLYLRPPAKGSPLYAVGLAFLVLTLIQSLVSPCPLRSLVIFTKLLICFLLWQFFLTRKDGLLWPVLSGILLFQGLGGLYQVFISQDPMPLSWALTPGIEPIKRAFGLFEDPNIFGTVMGIFTLSLFLDYGRFQRPVLWYMTLCSGFILLLTQSRGAILAFLLALLVLACLHSVMRRPALLLLALVLSGFFIMGRLQTLQEADLGVNQRLELLKGVKNYLHSHFALGTGPGTFHLYYPQYRTLGGYYPQYAHNHFLEIFCEQGLLGLSAFLALFVTAFRLFWSFARQGLSGPLILLVFAAVNALTNSSFSLLAPCLVLLFCIARQYPEQDFLPLNPVQINFLKGFCIFSILLSFLEISKGIFLGYEAKNQKVAVPVILQRDLDYALKAIELRLRQETIRDLDLQECLFWLNNLKLTHRQEGEVHFLMGRVLIRLKQEKLALIAYEQAHQCDPFSEKYALPLLEIYLQKNQDQFWPLAEKILYSNPDYRRINPYYDPIQALMLEWLRKNKNTDGLHNFLPKIIWVDAEFGRMVEGQL